LKSELQDKRRDGQSRRTSDGQKGRKLTHWSNKEGLTELDPARHGTGLSGAERRRKKDDPENWVNFR